MQNTEKTNSIDSKYDKIGGKLNGALILNDAVEITCDNSTLILNAQSNYFKVKGTTAIETFSGLANGFVIIEFLESRILINSTNIQLQSNVNKICKKGDCGIYYIENGIAKEINFYTAKEINTNSFQSQTILNAPKDEKGQLS